MIQNERQYKITQSRVREFEQALSRLETLNPTQHPRKILSEKNALLNTIQALQQEIADYDKLKQGQISSFRLQNLNEIPTTLIKARIALGITQRELGERIGVQEQQIQRYEANQYQSISFDRLGQVFTALGINFKDVVMEIDQLQSTEAGTRGICNDFYAKARVWWENRQARTLVKPRLDYNNFTQISEFKKEYKIAS
jgi:HTH-type transcriptional regulator / antitoxin HipB